MMKRKISLILSAVMLLVQTSFVYAEDKSMEKALIAVKEKVDIPEYLDEFETGSSEMRNGEHRYSFSWRSKDKEDNIYIQADDEGRILSFSEYNPDMNKGSGDLRIDTSFKTEAAEEFAKGWLLKVAPELYMKDDSPESMGLSGTLNPRSNRYNFGFKRIKGGIPVKDNTASVTVIKTESGFVVSDAYISWDYDASFSDAGSDIGIEEAEKLFTDTLPMKLIYRKTYEDKYLLEYVSNGTVYINAKEGKEAEEDKAENGLYPAEKEAMMTADSANVAGGGGARLTQAEIDELDKVAELKSTDELFTSLVNMPELGVPGELRAVATNHTYKTEDGYIARVSAYEDKTVKDGVKSTSVNATFDAKTGELIRFYRYSSDDGEYKTDEKNAKKAYAFLEKYFSGKTSECEVKYENNSAVCQRIVNSIPYENNMITASVNNNTGYVESFNITWDKDISKLPSSENIITADEAYEARYERYPTEKLYVKSGGEYKVMYTIGTYTVRIDAHSGDAVNYLGEKDEEKTQGIYSDISGHWVENIAKELARYNIYLEGNELKPDEKIKQSEFLMLVLNGVCGEFWKPEPVELYRNLESRNIVSKEERASEEPVKREDAVRYLLRAMGVGEVAEIENIFVCDFKDADMISKDRIGYCAIAKGYNIIGGSEGMLYPKSETTRAEALAMIYNYLIR